MHPLEAQTYQFVTLILTTIWNSHISTVLIPIITLMFLLRFLRWSNANSRGEREEDLREEWAESTGLANARVRRAMGQDAADPEGPRRYRRSAPGGRRRW